MKKLTILGFVISILSCSLPAMAADPAKVFGPGFGVNIKTERITERELDLIAALGIARVRIGITWYWVEFNRGTYQWNIPQPRHPAALDYARRQWSSYDEIIAAIRKRKLHIDANLMEGNEPYTGAPVNMAPAGMAPAYRHRAPRTNEAIDAFANFAGATARHYAQLYGSNAFTWHVWNEPDTDAGYAPKTDPGIVGRLMTKTCEAIRNVDSRIQVMGPSLSAYGDGDLRFDFIDGLFSQSNPLHCLSAFTIHPYRAAPAETARVDYYRVQQHLAPHQPAGRAVPIAVDEWGYSINRHYGEIPWAQRWRNFSGSEQAALMLRMYLTNLAAGIPVTSVYEWRDSGVDPYDWEHHFGITDYNGNAKPAFLMISKVWPILRNRPLLSEITAPGCAAQQHFMHFGSRGDDQSWVVAWTETGNKRALFNPAPKQIINIFGSRARVVAPGYAVKLTGVPLLMRFPANARPVFVCR